MIYIKANIRWINQYTAYIKNRDTRKSRAGPFHNYYLCFFTYFPMASCQNMSNSSCHKIYEMGHTCDMRYNEM